MSTTEDQLTHNILEALDAFDERTLPLGLYLTVLAARFGGDHACCSICF